MDYPAHRIHCITSEYLLNEPELPTSAGSSNLQGQTGPTGSGITGCTGSRGEEGSTGPRGLALTGCTGSRGIIGPPGEDGQTGPRGQALTGCTGPAGGEGPTGSMGPALTGCTGSRGIIGSPGEDGPTGAMGPIGPSLTGCTGSRGVIGSPGEDGPTGSMGPIGPSLTGCTGAPGPVGPIGSALTGCTGAPGPMGPSGLTGCTGAIGQGLTGPTGPGVNGMEIHLSSSQTITDGSFIGLGTQSGGVSPPEPNFRSVSLLSHTAGTFTGISFTKKQTSLAKKATLWIGTTVPVATSLSVIVPDGTRSASAFGSVAISALDEFSVQITQGAFGTGSIEGATVTLFFVPV